MAEYIRGVYFCGFLLILSIIFQLNSTQEIPHQQPLGNAVVQQDGVGKQPEQLQSQNEQNAVPRVRVAAPAGNDGSQQQQLPELHNKNINSILNRAAAAPFAGGGAGPGAAVHADPAGDNIRRTGMNKNKLAQREECQQDVESLCAKKIHGNDFAVLECLQTAAKDNDISASCQNYIWDYKAEMTTDLRFNEAAKQICKNALDRFAEDCKPLENAKGHLISCLMEHIENITSSQCKQYLVKMESIVFSDYHLVAGFVDDCKEDISKHQCGRFDTNPQAIHGQGATIECLSSHVNSVSRACQKQIYRVAEMQANDYHLDRALYYACRDDRERFCETTPAGEGRVYKCCSCHSN